MSTHKHKEPGENIAAEPILVKHFTLKYADDESIYRTICPVCDTGILLMARDMKTFHLLKNDRCTFCGQAVIYTDLDNAEQDLIEYARVRKHPATL